MWQRCEKICQHINMKLWGVVMTPDPQSYLPKIFELPSFRMSIKIADEWLSQFTITLSFSWTWLFVMIQYKSVRFGPNLVEMNPTSLPDLLTPLRTLDFEECMQFEIFPWQRLAYIGFPWEFLKEGIQRNTHKAWAKICAEPPATANALLKFVGCYPKSSK